MKNIIIIGAMMALLLSACTPMVPKNVKYANELNSSQLVAKHADYFRSEYAGTTKDEAFWAYYAILEGELLTQIYDLILESMDQETDGNSIISYIKIIKRTIMSTQLANYSKIWSNAINRHAHNKYSCVDFSTALYITNKEYHRIGVFSKLDTIKKKLKEKISTLDKHKYQRTYELYAVISQLMTLAEEPKGSLMTFNSTVNRLNTDFSKILALAELEF